MDANEVHSLRDIEESVLQSLAVERLFAQYGTYEKMDKTPVEVRPFSNGLSTIDITTKEIVTHIDKVRLPRDEWIVDGVNTLVEKIKKLREQPNAAHMSINPRKYIDTNGRTHCVYAIMLYYI